MRAEVKCLGGGECRRMSWFEQLTGFVEADYDHATSRLRIEGGALVSLANGARYRTGELELVSLADLRRRTQGLLDTCVSTTLREIQGDAKHLHADPAYAGALFQAASQFNLLEMTSPAGTPEQGVTRYAWDHTQGPACAIAAGAGTIYRNYFVPVGDRIGQTADHQLDGLNDLGQALAQAVGCSVPDLYLMQNGYAMASRDGLRAIADYLATIDETERDRLRGLLRIGFHQDLEVTWRGEQPFPLVSQAYCSALPIGYANHQASKEEWRPFASLVLEALYEATLLAGVLNMRRTASRIVLLTRVGGGVFDNPLPWIADAIDRASGVVRHAGLELLLVGRPAG